MVICRLLSCSEDRVHAEDSALARWVADPANTTWMDSKQQARVLRTQCWCPARPVSLVPCIVAKSSDTARPPGPLGSPASFHLALSVAAGLFLTLVSVRLLWVRRLRLWPTAGSHHGDAEKALP